MKVSQFRVLEGRFAGQIWAFKNYKWPTDAGVVFAPELEIEDALKVIEYWNSMRISKYGLVDCEYFSQEKLFNDNET